MAYNGNDASIPFSTDGIDSEKLIENIDKIKDSTRADYSGDKSRATAGTNTVAEKAYNTDGSKLNKVQDANQAKGQGQYGMFNDKDYSTTLRLARKVDEYNSRPRTQLMSVGTRNTGGVQSLGYGYDKPGIDSMESKAIKQTINLDTNQKQLAQQLQAAVNAKDLEAFKQLVAQLYNVQLTDYQANIAMDQMAYQTEMAQIATKDLKAWQDTWARYFGAETAATLYNLVQDNETWAIYLSDITTGKIPADKADQFASDFIQSWLKRTNVQTPEQATNELEAAKKALIKLNIKYDVATKAAVRVGDNFITNAAATVKEYYNSGE